MRSCPALYGGEEEQQQEEEEEEEKIAGTTLIHGGGGGIGVTVLINNHQLDHFPFYLVAQNHRGLRHNHILISEHEHVPAILRI